METGSEGESNRNINGQSNRSKKPKHQRKTPFQLVMLEKAYAQEARPSEATRAKLSETLGLTESQLQMWFYQRRLKAKKECTVKRRLKVKKECTVKRTSEEGDPSVHSKPETPNSGGPTIPPPTSKYVSEFNGEGKVSQSSLQPIEFVAELCAMRVTRDNEVEVMKKRLELEQKREERKTEKMHHMHLNTLLAKDHLSPEDEDMKRRLMAMLYGK